MNCVYASGWGVSSRTSGRILGALCVVALLGSASVGQDLLESKVGKDFRQPENLGPPVGDILWSNSILQQNNSVYFEGVSVPQRIIFTSIAATTGDVHSLLFNHQVSKADIHAYDFLTSWDQAQLAADIIAPGQNLLQDLFTDACGAAIGPKASTVLCNSLRASAYSCAVDLPDGLGPVGGAAAGYTNDVAPKIATYEANPTLGNRTLTIYGNAPFDCSVAVTFMTFTGYTGGADKDAHYYLQWASASTDVLVEVAGHLAVGPDNAAGVGIGYGPGYGASAISGGPYHFKMTTLDGASLGSQDNQIKGADIIEPFCVPVDRCGPGGVDDDGIDCTIDTCDELNHTCIHTPDDGFCDDFNSCTDDVCDPALDCQNTPDDSNTCTDGELCTTDACVAGACVGTQVDCAHLDDQCNVGVCDPLSGWCEAEASNEGGECDDGDPCTVNDVCGGGVCAGVSKDCAHLDNQCNVGVCNPVTGVCEREAANEGANCDDGFYCTVDEVCVGGTCSNGAPRDCSDGIDCTVDTCDDTLDQCVHTPDNAFCNDTWFCTGVEYCDSDVGCVSPGDPCTAPSKCDEDNDSCVACTDNSQCDDNQYCNGVETCDTLTGECVPGTDVDCGDGIDCTVDSCNETDDICVNTLDDSACLDDGNECTIIRCDADNGCIPVPVDDGTPCDDTTNSDCDNPDTCVAGVCVPNYEPTNTLCTDDSNECTDDVCDGAGGCSHPSKADQTACIDDGNECTDDVCLAGVCDHPARSDGTICNGSPSGVCDVQDTCVGGVCVDHVESSGTLCRLADGLCDLEEACDGASKDCPPDDLVAGGIVCRSVAGLCDLEEVCSGTSKSCPLDGVRGDGAVCRASMGGCDPAEVCDGIGVDCPADELSSAGTVCRESAGDCDVAESCAGTSASCPSDGFEPSTTECRSSTGDCDVAEFCSGSSASCPSDGFEPSTTECRVSAGVCDVVESCTGTSASCPSDGFEPSTTECRASAGICDVAESCTGSSADCPSDGFEPSSTVCRVAAGDCDVAESCTGTSADCPTDGKKPGGTDCDDGDLCNGLETCDTSGNCQPGDPVVCLDDSLVCNGPEHCDEVTGECVSAPPLCDPATERCCEDEATCIPIGGGNAAAAAASCCNSSECPPDPDVCTDSRCNPNTNTCELVPIVPCCGNDILETGEECDRAADDACGGEPCLSDCTCQLPDGIPTATTWGMAALALILLVGGKIYFGHRRRHAVEG